MNDTCGTFDEEVEGSQPIVSYDDEHEAFAASRVSKYVYVPTKDSFFNQLDQHADTLDGDVKLPLVLLGNEGSGKSALLANWVARRREHKHRDEFLFSHFVGCTTQSLQLQATLLRLETALKDFFQLREMKVPDSEVELRWSLNRFLEAASKKHFPARIVIIIDGVDRLKAEGAPIGALHWLPAELPHCVRFIVSSVEFERNYRGKKESIPHRTFVELQRRQCPVLRVEQLGANTRSSVIASFSNLYPESFELTESQQFKIVTAQSSAQPMYLRTLLQAFRLATSLTTQGHDQLLEKLLGCITAHELIDKTLSICCQDAGDDEGLLADSIGKMFAMVFVARKGLTEEEIWALLKMESKFEPSVEQSTKLMSILKEFTMVVNGLHSFSHEIYREVAYHKYISSREQLLRWHNIMARFFGQLPPCDRKLEGLPYHLEMAGSWNKVKNCLTDIEMFLIWWSPKFKFDFLNFWAGLTGTASESEKQEHSIAETKKKSKKDRDNDINYDENTAILRPRPRYDIVEEYVKSLDEYRTQKHPTDEAVAEIILAIADFLLEFSMLGHENDADVPGNIHPKILSEDLKSIGVPYIEIDEEGRTSLVFPQVLDEYTNKKDENAANDGPGGNDAAGAARAIDEMPLRTAYFFSRWMWIQFPYIALGNCNARYTQGVKRREQEIVDNPGLKSKSLNEEAAGSSVHGKNKRSGTAGEKRAGKVVGIRGTESKEEGQELSKSMSSADLAKMLPPIKFNRKAQRSSSRVIKVDDEQDAANTKFENRMMALQDNIQNLREEYDFIVQMKAIVSNRLQVQIDTKRDLDLTAESASQFFGALDIATKREEEARNRAEGVVTLNTNLVQLHIMCNRHPANWAALILELQSKVQQDEYLLHEIKKRLWEQKFEKQTAMMSYHKVKSLVAESVEMHNQLLEFRYEQRKAVTQQANEDAAAMANGGSSKPHSSTRAMRDANKTNTMMSTIPEEVQAGDQKMDANSKMTWEEIWAIINSRTGMVEPDAFFQRINNGPALIEQINAIKKTSESRLEAMKKEVVVVEMELEEVRYEASFAGVQSSKEHMKQLTEKQQRLRQTKEKTETAEQLEQNVVAGLAHVSDILFIPKSEDDAPVINLVRDIEAVLDTLINEREKQLQQQQGQQSGGDKRETSNIVIAEAHRSPELDFVIAKHESPKVRLPPRLPSRPSSGGKVSRGVVEDLDENEEEGMWDRTFAKTSSLKSINKGLKKLQKSQKEATM